MAKITLTQKDLPNPNDFKKWLEQTEKRHSTIDDIFNLLRELVAFEQEHKLVSDIFYARFMRGEMGDALPFIKWAGRYELYLEAKQELESQIAKIPQLGSQLVKISLAEKLFVSSV